MSEQKLPMANGTSAKHGDEATQPPRQVEVSSLRLVATLAIAGALAGMAIVTAFKWTKPSIDAHAALELQKAVLQVLGGATTYKTAFLENGQFTLTQPADTAGVPKVYVGYDPNGQPRGVAMEAAEPGFQDVITLLFGYDPSTRNVIGMKVLNSNETPGLGARITNDSVFIKQFDDVATPLVGVKEGQGKGKKDEVVMITGSTISSRAVIKIIDDKLDVLQKPVDAYWATIAGTASPAPSAEGAEAATPSQPVAPTARGGGR